MIIYREWVTKTYRDNYFLKSITKHQAWYLFGFIPLYHRKLIQEV